MSTVVDRGLANRKKEGFKVTDSIREYIYNYRYVKPKRKKIDFSQIRKQFPHMSYKVFAEGIERLIEEGVVEAVKEAGTNGMLPPLPKKFWIRMERANDCTEEIRDLHRRFLNLQYLENRDKYDRDRDIIKPISDFLKEYGEDAISFPLGCNERALQIWGNEKFLTRANRERLVRVLSDSRLPADYLNFRYTPEPFDHFVVHGEDRRSDVALIVENKDTYGSLKRLQGEFGIGLPYGIVIFGYGNRVSRAQGDVKEFLDYLGETSGIRISRCDYFGDLDPEGIGILQRVSETNDVEIRAHRDFYRMLVSEGRNRSYPILHQQRPVDDISILGLSCEDEAFVLDMFHQGRFVPQEAINTEKLYSYFKRAEKRE